MVDKQTEIKWLDFYETKQDWPSLQRHDHEELDKHARILLDHENQEVLNLEIIKS